MKIFNLAMQNSAVEYSIMPNKGEIISFAVSHRRETEKPRKYVNFPG